MECVSLNVQWTLLLQIIQDTDNKFYELNHKWSNTWPNITQMRKEDVPKDAEEWAGVEN